MTHTTIAERLTAAGHDPATCTGEHIGPQLAAAVTSTRDDGSQIVGMLYQLNYRAEEEFGVGDLMKNLTGPDPKNLTVTAPDHVAVFTDVPGLVLSTRPMPARELPWGADPETGNTTADWMGRERKAGWRHPYATFYLDTLPYARQDPLARQLRLGRVTMATLREKAEEVGLPRPWARSKHALTDQLLTSAEYRESVDLVEAWPGWFDDGRHLVLRADDGPTRVVMEALQEAVAAGKLGLTTHSGPFSAGVFVYDTRDETPASIQARHDAVDWHRARMDELEPVAAKLRQAGHSWYFLGSPRLAKDDHGSDVVKYWLNGASGGVAADGTRCRRQPFGWYSLAELEAEKFIRDAVAREAEEDARQARKAAAKVG